MKELIELWEEFEQWYVVNSDHGMKVPEEASFGQFIAWMRDVYPLKSEIINTQK